MAIKIKSLVCILLLFTGLASLGQQKKGGEDHFAQIGNRVQATRTHLLEDKLPPVLPEKYLLAMERVNKGFSPIEKLDTEEELKAELARMRKEFLPFMKNYAPEIEKTRERLPLSEFQWREETAADRTNFASALQGQGSWTTVQIPHYGPPEGRATTYYYKEFELPGKMQEYENQFICFKGVDYIAEVFVNGALAGTHTGFFAPFEFDITKYLVKGTNTLLVKVKNDFSTLGSPDGGGEKRIGDKIYAASGLGWDDPVRGWHHCPPGMGIYQDCYIESRAPLHFNDIFVRPLPEEESAEVWFEINNYHPDFKYITLDLNLYGQNFEATEFENLKYTPSTTYVPGVGDLAKPQDWQESKLHLGYGVNFFKVKIPVKSPKIWNNDTPWLYQLQVELQDEEGNLLDKQASSFGMRTFTQDTKNTPKGHFYLNGERIRLRGANTMGFLQNDVKNKDWEQLIDDILLAKICNMNFIRLTQRPVQPEIYEYCDQLGMMLQTDLPLFGSLRPHLMDEAVKQAGEMERLVRNHPSNVVVTYINERFSNGEGHPQRNMPNAEDYYKLFKACDQLVHHWNPDRVIKAGDGDYDPPSPGLPDNHCYNTWYNGHGLGLGELHKGHWMKVKPGWLYGCGEFGAEAFDSYEVMKKYWPESWLPQDESKAWMPNKVSKAQTHRFHYMWYPTPDKLEDWIEASQDHQAWATRLVTEAFRRDNRMLTFAIHLFIDAWPAGWMKAIMDVDRTPKKAFFAYRDALAPVMVNLRTDRYKYYGGEKASVEAWICNDPNTIPQGYELRWQIEKNGKVIYSAQADPKFIKNGSQFQGYIDFDLPQVKKRTKYDLRLALFNEEDKGISESLIELEAFPTQKPSAKGVYTDSHNGRVRQLLNEIGTVVLESMDEAQTIVVENHSFYLENKTQMDKLVENGSTLLFLELPEGKHKVGNSEVGIEKTIMGEYYFVSPKTGHSLVKNNEDFDFHFWYDQSKNTVRPFLNSMIVAKKSWMPILGTGKTTWKDIKGEYFAAAEMKHGKGLYRICQVQLNNRLEANPTAFDLLKGLID
ncbi:glycoside hydrolase family 2 [Maribellus luteus]|uniref:Glycoside hydrolase family 2 n=1 Tax=Maribellus luteus TaxID=2305463 RepID=A0A399T263_9BACT|nr:sugar-binding domain-containing protein [Maribellus luteus]RIJ50406.1 glycoside hydrolase family 2 [Maribellus luteus]